MAPAVEGPPSAEPPLSPAGGACYIVGENAVGAWAGKQNSLAAYTSGGWRFIAPRDGLTAFVRGTGEWITYVNGGWISGEVRGSALVLGGEQVVGSRGAAIASPTGGSVVDSEARAAIGQVLNALRLHGLIES